MFHVTISITTWYSRTNVTLRWWFKRASSTNRSINLCPALRFEIAFEEIVFLPRARPNKQHSVENDRDPLGKQILLKYRRILIRGTLSFDVFFSGDTRTGPAARAGTLTYIHTYVSKPMSTRRTVDHAIAIVVRRRTRPGNRAARFNIFEIARSLGQRARPSTSDCPTFRSCFYTLTLRIIGRIIGPVALLLRRADAVPSSHTESDSQDGSCEQMRGRCS